MVSRLLLRTYRASLLDLCWFFSAKLLDGDVELDLFGIFSGSLLDADVELEAVHEIMVLFPLLFLLGRAR